MAAEGGAGGGQIGGLVHVARAEDRHAAGDQPLELLRRGQQPPHAAPGGEADGALRIEIQRIARGHQQGVALERDGEHAVMARPPLRQQRDGTAVHTGEVGGNRVDEGGVAHTAMIARRRSGRGTGVSRR